ncbi:MAG: hypothetical protein DMG70_28030 [Acidobacteria bacterium]|nr:MAG: hypothetical protein DMG70_28030 [Acidobacteriota bacterium]
MRHVNRYTVFGEISVPSVQGWNGCGLGCARTIAQAFVATEEKQLVLDDFSSGSRTELVAMKWRFWRAGKAINVIEKSSPYS